VTIREHISGGHRFAGGLAGVLAASTALGVAELAAAVVRGQASPVIAVGGVFVDNVPKPLKDFAIRTFGENDKIVLVAGILVTIVVLAALVGAAAATRPMVGIVGVTILGLVAAAAAVSRPAASAFDALPSLIGAAAGLVALLLLLRTLAGPPPRQQGSDVGMAEGSVPTSGARRPGAGMLPDSLARTDRKGSGFDRRSFLLTSALTAAVAAVTGGAGRAILARRFDVSASRNALTLPAPASPAPALTAGVEVGVPGVTPFTTPNEDFYRVDTALIVPQLSTTDYLLRIHGRVDRELELTFEDLLKRPMIERDITISCVSVEVGGKLNGTARWLGVPLKDLLEEAGVRSGANQVVSRSIDGMTIGTPTESLMDGRDAMLAIGMNGEPLPAEHGFPVRMIVPGLYGYVSATKWLTEIELTTFDDFDPYWVERGWDAKAPVKTFSRIDTPNATKSPAAGVVPVAGIAYAQHRGISAVEVRIDGGPWQRARLADEGSIDLWRQWAYDWPAAPGPHRLEVRATDGPGQVQPEERVPPFPGGATGWHSVLVTVT
jgi:DMSO/TMAO reductase YedYZ molybdopterin-dependent catalytic subunit